MKFNKHSKLWYRGIGLEELSITNFSYSDEVSVFASISVFCPPQNQQKVKAKQSMDFTISERENKNILEARIRVGKNNTEIEVEGCGIDKVFDLLKENDGGGNGV
jgi:hypothetical protein